MKFYILVKNKEFGEIKSETYNGEESQYKQLIEELLKPSLEQKLDFYDDKGDFVVISKEIISNSLIYVKRLDS